jgi:hypothetical protein
VKKILTREQLKSGLIAFLEQRPDFMSIYQTPAYTSLKYYSYSAPKQKPGEMFDVRLDLLIGRRYVLTDGKRCWLEGVQESMVTNLNERLERHYTRHHAPGGFYSVVLAGTSVHWERYKMLKEIDQLESLSDCELERMIGGLHARALVVERICNANKLLNRLLTMHLLSEQKMFWE